MHRVFAPWVAAQNALDGEVAAFNDAPFLDGSDSVVRAGGLVPAFVGAQQGRQQNLVEPDQQNEREANDFGQHHIVNLYPTPRME